jgi:hypothetical protein
MKHERHERKHLCVKCGVRPARYRYHGQVKADRSHVLCFQCYRAVRDSQRLAHPRTFGLRGRSTVGVESDPPDRTGTSDR